VRAAYLRLHPCVQENGCEACGSKVNEPCYSQSTGLVMRTEVHPSRKDVYYGRVAAELEREKFKVVRKEAMQRRARA
jgi:hypothetical protein